MRRACVLLLGLSVVLGSLTAPAAEVAAVQEDAPAGHNALRKLGRGIANLLLGFVEVPNQITKTQAAQGGASGFGYGVPKGIYRWVQREFVGVYEIVTFPIPAPRGYKPVMRPEWPSEDYEL